MLPVLPVVPEVEVPEVLLVVDVVLVVLVLLVVEVLFVVDVLDVLEVFAVVAVVDVVVPDEVCVVDVLAVDTPSSSSSSQATVSNRPSANSQAARYTLKFFMVLCVLFTWGTAANRTPVQRMTAGINNGRTGFALSGKRWHGKGPLSGGWVIFSHPWMYVFFFTGLEADRISTGAFFNAEQSHSDRACVAGFGFRVR